MGMRVKRGLYITDYIDRRIAAAARRRQLKRQQIIDEALERGLKPRKGKRQ